MKIAKLHILPLMVGALIAGGPASAAPTEADFVKTEQEAHTATDRWRDDMKRSFSSFQKHDAHVKAAQDLTDKLRVFLIDRPCRNGAQAKAIETYIHNAFHTMYGTVVADIKHGVDLNCRSNLLAVTFWITDYTPDPKTEDLQNTNTSMHEIDTATKRLLGNWSTAVAPILTDKSKKIEDVRAQMNRVTEQLKAQAAVVACYDTAATTGGTKSNLATATQQLSQNFTGYKLDFYCPSKKLDLYYNFMDLKRKGT